MRNGLTGFQQYSNDCTARSRSSVTVRKLKARLTTLSVLPGLSTENLSWPFSRWAFSITCRQMSLGTTPCTPVQQHTETWHPGMTECSQQCGPNPELLVARGGRENRGGEWFFTSGPLKQDSFYSTKAHDCFQHSPVSFSDRDLGQMSVNNFSIRLQKRTVFSILL